MLVPKFRCFQDQNFIKIELVLSALCKVSEAQFDILEHQFTFSCSPYYLRLTFPCLLTEERGERATYDLEKNILTVFVPKLNIGEEFPGLEFPNQLLATSKQRREMGLSLITEVGKEKGDDEDDDDEDDGDQEDEKGERYELELKENTTKNHDDDDDDENEGQDVKNLETEFDQMLQISEQEKCNKNVDDDETVYYGFNNQFTRFFGELDEDLTRELVDLPNPDTTRPLDRKSLRKADEDANFDEGVFLYSMNDEEGEIERDILPFKPWYVQCFEEALIAAGRKQRENQQQRKANDNNDATANSKKSYRTPGDIGADFANDAAPANDMITSKADKIWQGNAIQMIEGDDDAMKLLDDENSSNNNNNNTNNTAAAESTKVITFGNNNNNDNNDETTSPQNSSNPEEGWQQKSSRNGLAYTVPPPNTPDFTMDESTTLQSIPAKNFFLHSESLVCWQLCDILAATVYDVLSTQGQGTVESAWTITKLSSCLSWLDSPQSAQDFADTFCRRVLTFPLHRHFGLALRCLRDVSILLLSGPKTIVKVLLYAKQIIDSCDTSGSKHALSALWINPLLSWLTSSFNNKNHVSPLREKFFIRTADELHGYVVRGEILKNASIDNNNAIANIGSRKTAAVLVVSDVNDSSSENNNNNNNPSLGRELQPLAWTSLKLPFSEELMDEVA